MKMSRKRLDELIRLIATRVLNEWSSLSGDDNNDPDQGTADDKVKPDDAKTAVEKSREERQARKTQQDRVRTANLDLTSTKKQQSYFDQQSKKNKLDIQAKQKQLQALKGATSQSTTVPAGGTIAKI